MVNQDDASKPAITRNYDLRVLVQVSEPPRLYDTVDSITIMTDEDFTLTSDSIEEGTWSPAKATFTMSPELEPYIVLDAPRNSTGLYLTGTYKATVEADELVGMPNLFVEFIIYDAIEYHSQVVRIAM